MLSINDPATSGARVSRQLPLPLGEGRGEGLAERNQETTLLLFLGSAVRSKEAQ